MRMGTSTESKRPQTNVQDQPHAYGDKSDKGEVEIYQTGSSPRVWGQASSNLLSVTSIRIIPTRMGTRPNFATQICKPKDHPHAYGDKLPYTH